MNEYMRPFDGMQHPMFFLGGLRFLVGLLVLALIAFVVIRLLRKGRVGPVRMARDGGHPGAAGPTPEDEALGILRRRLAEGSISPEEYLERSSVLRRSTPPEV